MWATTAPLGRRLSSRVAALARAAATGGSVRAEATLAQALYARDPSSLAVVVPTQGIRWTYNDLSLRVGSLAERLASQGYAAGDVVATDLGSSVENLLLQLAASQLGLAVLTVKGEKDFAKLSPELNPRGIVPAVNGFLAAAQLPLGHVSVETDEVGKPGAQAVAGDGAAPLGYYNSAKAVRNDQALEVGRAAVEKLAMTSTDVVLVSITLNHLFGIGSAVSAALQSGAAIVLLDADAVGVVGCGNPTKRAQATLEYLDSVGCTLLFADTHTHKALLAEGPAQLRTLRGGVCKVGSGSTFLEPTVDLAGVPLVTIGKA